MHFDSKFYQLPNRNQGFVHVKLLKWSPGLFFQCVFMFFFHIVFECVSGLDFALSV